MSFNALKVVVAVVGLIAVAVFALGPSLGFNVSPEKLLELFVNAMTAVINFLAKVVEDLFS